jgi:vacuolar-type H+-ATPase subunit I/STV1
MFPILRHASSHGLSVLICTVVAAFLVKYIDKKVPNFFNWLENQSTLILKKFNLVPADFLVVILVTAILAFIWGIFFKLSLPRKN